LRIAQEKKGGGITLLKITGCMTVENIFDFSRMFTTPNRVAGNGKKILLDLREVDSIDSSGIGAIAFLARRYRIIGGMLNIASLQDSAREAYQMLEFEKVLKDPPRVKGQGSSNPVQV
jgi:anti-anti-sigma factor